MLSVDLKGPASYAVIGGSGSRRHIVIEYSPEVQI